MPTSALQSLMEAAVRSGVSRKDFRSNNIQSVQDAVNNWASNSSISNTNITSNTYTQFVSIGSRLVADISPAVPTGQCASPDLVTSVRLLPTSRADLYRDETSKFNAQTIPTHRFTATLPIYPAACSLQISIKDSMKGNATVGSIIVPAGPQLVRLRPNYGSRSCPSYIQGCTSSSRDANACIQNCNDMGGTYSCSASTPQCTVLWNWNDACVKIRAVGQDTWASDNLHPAPDDGCSPLPIQVAQTVAGQYFQVPNVSSAWGPNSAHTLTVRSSADPWLAYIAATEGTGSFGASKVFTRRMPATRPATYFDGRAWDVANRWGYVTGYPVYNTPGVAQGYQMSHMPPAAPTGPGGYYPVPPPQYPQADAYGQPPPYAQAAYPPGSYPPPPYGYPQAAYGTPYIPHDPAAWQHQAPGPSQAPPAHAPFK
ncbi:hypothetical protein QJQ45_030127 [Haematococcus lacustris]|nr:hypothetical protein QJQ45_030127 [Haematococcus lacustris]